MISLVSKNRFNGGRKMVCASVLPSGCRISTSDQRNLIYSRILAARESENVVEFLVFEYSKVN